MMCWHMKQIGNVTDFGESIVSTPLRHLNGTSRFQNSAPRQRRAAASSFRSGLGNIASRSIFTFPFLSRLPPRLRLQHPGAQRHHASPAGPKVSSLAVPADGRSVGLTGRDPLEIPPHELVVVVMLVVRASLEKNQLGAECGLRFVATSMAASVCSITRYLPFSFVFFRKLSLLCSSCISCSLMQYQGLARFLPCSRACIDPVALM